MKNRKHGQAGTPLYYVWAQINQRCNNPNNRQFKNYGSRGIMMFDEWKYYPAFYSWAIVSGYKPGLSIDRINNSGNYYPENCRWVSQKV